MIRLSTNWMFGPFNTVCLYTKNKYEHFIFLTAAFILPADSEYCGLEIHGCCGLKNESQLQNVHFSILYVPEDPFLCSVPG